MCDIEFKESNYKFNYRVAVIFSYDNKILFQKIKGDTYYSLIGGSVKLGEIAVEAISREIKEEVGINIGTEKLYLSRICENFFEYNNIKFHELLFVYIADLDESEFITKCDSMKCLDDENTTMIWVNNNDIKALDIRPDVVKEIIEDRNFKHIIIK